MSDITWNEILKKDSLAIYNIREITLSSKNEDEWSRQASLSLVVPFTTAPSQRPPWPTRMQLGPRGRPGRQPGNKLRYSPSAGRSFLGQFRAGRPHPKTFAGKQPVRPRGSSMTRGARKWREIGRQGQKVDGVNFWKKYGMWWWWHNQQVVSEADESGHSQFLNPCPEVVQTGPVQQIGQEGGTSLLCHCYFLFEQSNFGSLTSLKFHVKVKIHWPYFGANICPVSH